MHNETVVCFPKIRIGALLHAIKILIIITAEEIEEGFISPVTYSVGVYWTCFLSQT